MTGNPSGTVRRPSTRRLIVSARTSRRLALAAVAAVAGATLPGGAMSPLMLGATGAGLVGRGAYQLRHHTRAGQ